MSFNVCLKFDDDRLSEGFREVWKEMDHLPRSGTYIALPAIQDSSDEDYDYYEVHQQTTFLPLDKEPLHMFSGKYAKVAFV